MEKKEKLIFGIAVLVVLGLWVFAPFVVQKLFPTWTERGQFGDLFGSVNALFSGLAFIALIYTIYLQRQELALQRDELKLQREEMVASRGELAEQVAAQKSLVVHIDTLNAILVNHQEIICTNQRYVKQATIAQIKITAKQAHIEMLNTKLARAKTDTPNDEMWTKYIDEIILEIENIANELEKN